MTTWYKFPVSYWDDARMFKLRRIVGESALWLPARLWTFAVSQDGSGDVSDYQASELADALRYPQDGPDVIKAFKDSGYLDPKGRIVGWAELFSLPASRKAHSQRMAAARWGKKTPSPNPSDRREEKEKKERGEERDSHALHDAMHDASALPTVPAIPPAPVSFPWSSLEQMPDEHRKLFKRFGAKAPEVFAEIRGRKIKYSDKHFDRDWLHVLASETKEAAKERKGNGRGFSEQQDYSEVTEKSWSSSTERSLADPEPEGWQAFAAANLPAFEPERQYHGKAWRDLPGDVQTAVKDEIEKASRKKAAS